MSGQVVVTWNDVERGPQSMLAGPECRDVGIERAAPIRRAYNYQHRRNYEGLYWCAGTGSHVWYESMTEYTSLMYLDHKMMLTAVAAQPLCLVFEDGTMHYPDYFATLQSGRRILIDVKPHERMDDVVRAQFDKTATACRLIGWDYDVLHGLQTVPRHNLEWLSAYRHPWNAPSGEDRSRLLLFLAQPRELREAMMFLSPAEPAFATHNVYHLMWSRDIDFELDAPLDWSTIVRSSDV